MVLLALCSALLGVSTSFAISHLVMSKTIVARLATPTPSAAVATTVAMVDVATPTPAAATATAMEGGEAEVAPERPTSAPPCPTEAKPLTNSPKGLTATASTENKPVLDPSQSHIQLVSSALEPLISQLTVMPRPFPEISPQARLARVPVMMYHDILSEKQVFFDVTPEEFEQDLQLIRDRGLTPVSLDQLVYHLSTGSPLPDKPILLTFDDGYAGHYTHVYPLLKQYGYPGLFAIYTAKVSKHLGRSSLTWEQLQEMAADPLVTIASHSVTHHNLGELTGEPLRREIVESKRILEEHLGITIHHFVYPEGTFTDEAKYWLKLTGYQSALTMRNQDEQFASDSVDLLSIERFGQSRLEEVIDQAYGGPPLPPPGSRFNFNVPLRVSHHTINNVSITLISGGKPITIHADSRYQVPEIIANTQAIAAVDGGFFSLKSLDSNVMVGPVLSQSDGKFIPGNASENPKLNGRPLVLISDDAVLFIPFNADRHNTLEGIQAEKANVTDAFVGAAFLVRDGQPQPPSMFSSLADYDAARQRAFWGIDQAGQPMIGVSKERVDAVSLGEILSQVGFRDAVMLDSGASTSLVYQGESLTDYTPRPVPHVVALVPPAVAASACNLVSQQ